MIVHPSRPAGSALRQRMIEDMTVRGFTAKTQHDYIRYVKTFAAFLGRSPDKATAEDLRRFQVHQTQAGLQPPGINSAVAALRFFFTVTLDRADLARRLTLVHEPRKVPLVLSPAEVAQLLAAAPGPKYKAALSAAYGAGLRVSEVVSLKVCDIGSQRMLIRIEQGKGRKDRSTSCARSQRASQKPSRPALKATAMRVIVHPAVTALSRQRWSNRKRASSSAPSFFKGWRSSPGTIPATSQLDRLISMTATSVLLCSKGTRDRLRSSGFAMGRSIGS
jgi:site-specific recombinase XerD